MGQTTKSVVSSSLTTIQGAEYVWIVCFSASGKDENGRAVSFDVSEETMAKVKEQFCKTLETLNVPFKPTYAVLNVPANAASKREADKISAEIYAKLIKESK